MIKAPKGSKIISVDYSQAELRVASWLSGDENMQNAYRSGSDLHTSTMNLLFRDNLATDHDGAKRQRTQAKSANFGFLYGMMAKTFVGYALGYGLNLTEDESAELRENFFKAYPRLLPWHKESVEFAKRYGYVVSPIGRKRFLPNIFSSDWKYRSQAERQAINSVVQGLASDMCISALADIVFSDELDHSKFNVLGSVHDAILIECKEDYAEELGQKVADIMAHPSVLEGLEVPVPFTGDVEIGDSWGE